MLASLARVGAVRPSLRLATRALNIHEYQSQELMAKFGVPAPRGIAATTAAAAGAACTALGGGRVVVKSQVLAGGRGKGTFANGFEGGVHLVEGAAAAEEIAGKMLGQR
jgi:succinyl-CoA synthetase beta subunit